MYLFHMFFVFILLLAETVGGPASYTFAPDTFSFFSG